MLDISRDIHSLTDFKKNTSEYLRSAIFGGRAQRLFTLLHAFGPGLGGGVVVVEAQAWD